MENAATIEPGAFGDLVLYEGDILAGEFDRGKVAAVAKGGVLYVESGEWIGPNAAWMIGAVRSWQDQNAH